MQTSNTDAAEIKEIKFEDFYSSILTVITMALPKQVLQLVNTLKIVLVKTLAVYIDKHIIQYFRSIAAAAVFSHTKTQASVVDKFCFKIRHKAQKGLFYKTLLRKTTRFYTWNAFVSQSLKLVDIIKSSLKSLQSS